jgi:glycosyltransferase involved in cell wall biosynthesis/predicted metal-dependent phosphoesterase TrpH
MSIRRQPPLKSSTRIDLHCHSRASTEADEALLAVIRCPESYSEPRQIHVQAKERGMDFVTITDHDSIAGVAELSDLPDVMVGEELTCYFPEDHCKMHVLVWGINQADHDMLQASAEDLYACAQYIAQKNIAHAVAHPLYRQNDKLDHWHIERLLLLFKGFECLNGAHSMRHRQAFEPLLEELDAAEIARLEEEHKLPALWPKPWIKSRTGGSDDHGLLNIGRTWTEFPREARTLEEVLDCLRDGRCRPGGEAGSSIKLAHNFYGVGIRYYTRQLARPGLRGALLRRAVGDRPSSGRLSLASKAVRFYTRGTLNKIGRTLGLKRPPRGVDLLGELFAASATARWDRQGSIGRALREGRAALAEHEPVFDLMSGINRDVSAGIFSAVADAINDGELGTICDALSAIVAHQALMAPYYFALFHQNQERHLLGRLTGRGPTFNAQSLRVGVFTDEADPCHPAGRFAVGLARLAQERELDLTIHAMGATEGWRNFKPLAAHRMAGMDIRIPPVLEVLEWADSKQFDVVLINTAGPMGLCGWLVSRMLRCPMVAMNHVDIPARVLGLSGGDHRLGSAAAGFAKWLYSAADKVMVRSHAGQDAAKRMEVRADRTVLISPTPPVPVAAQADVRIMQPVRLVCLGDIASRKDMLLVANAFAGVRKQRDDVALVIAGEGPWVKTLIEITAGLAVYLISNGDPSEVFAKADLLLAPDSTDVTGQMVIDAQTAGVPAIVNPAGAGKEFMDHDLTGLVVAADARAWAAAILQILGDEPRRQRMARTARQRAQRFMASNALEAAWKICLTAAMDDAARHGQRPLAAASEVTVA